MSFIEKSTYVQAKVVSKAKQGTLRGSPPDMDQRNLYKPIIRFHRKNVGVNTDKPVHVEYTVCAEKNETLVVTHRNHFFKPVP